MDLVDTVVSWRGEIVAVIAVTGLCSYFRPLQSVLVDLAHLLLMGDWNVILNPKLVRERGDNGWQLYRSLVYLIAEFRR